MAYTDPTTVHVPAIGGTAPAAWGTAVNTDLNWLHDVPATWIYKSAVQSLADSTNTVLTWDVDFYDPEGMFTTDSPTIVTVPVTGFYLVSANLEFAGSATGTRYLRIYKDAVLRGQVYEQGDADGNHLGITIQTTASAGETFLIYAEQSSGGPLNCAGAVANQGQFMVSLIRET